MKLNLSLLYALCCVGSSVLTMEELRAVAAHWKFNLNLD